MKKLLPFFALLLSGAVYAGSAQLSWGPPTQNTDGSALTNLTSYKIFSATSSAACGTGTATTIAAPATSYTITNLNYGTLYFCLKAVNANGTESVISNIVSKAIPDAIPNPPTGLTVTATTAYYPQVQQDRVVMIDVGVVPSTTVADASRIIVTGGKTYCGVPRTEVTWYGKTKPLSIFGLCG